MTVWFRGKVADRSFPILHRCDHIISQKYGKNDSTGDSKILINLNKGFRSIVFIFIVISTVDITIKMKTIFWKPLMIKINKLRLRNLDN